MSRLVEEALEYRRAQRGIIGVEGKVPVLDASRLSLLYTPGVAEACTEIFRDPALSFDYTCRGNTVAMVTDGSHAQEMGNVGAGASLPLMEAKAVIFKTFTGVDAFPICLNDQDAGAIVRDCVALAPTFGAFFLDHIAAPKCFAVVEQLQRALQVPVYHDNQHGVAIEVLAGLTNALKVVGKSLEAARIVINGAGAAGIATADLLARAACRDVVLYDRADCRGSLAEALRGADVYIGFSSGEAVTVDTVKSMASDPIIFALASSIPEIAPELAREGGARVIATGRSDYANQLDTALVFPGFFRGLLDTRARSVNAEMMRAAATAIAGLVDERSLSADHIVPDVMDVRVGPAVAAAVARAAEETGQAQIDKRPEEVAERTIGYVHSGRFATPARSLPKGRTVSLRDEALDLRKRYGGVLEVKSKIRSMDRDFLSALCLPPGAFEPAKAIVARPSEVYELTVKNNLVAIVTDGSAVLGLGNIGARAALPVMEGKAILFKTFAGVEAFPICLDTQQPDEIVEIVKNIAPTFGGVNLEDISAPRCFAIEERLRNEMDIPVFHDDQHGTAIVVLAALLNALKVTGRKIEDVKVVMNGAGSAGVAVARMLLVAGARNVTICDRQGAIYPGRPAGMNETKEAIAGITNPEGLKGTLAEVIGGADVFIGVSSAGALTVEMARSMAKGAVIFALANPVPEIMPGVALEAGASVVATGRSDFRNQVNNCLVFPGVFRGALDSRARRINDRMKLAAAHAIASLVADANLEPGYIIPAAMDFRVPPKVAAAVARSAVETGEAQIAVDPDVVEENTRSYIYEGNLGSVSQR